MREIEITYKKLQTIHHGLQMVDEDEGRLTDEVEEAMSTLWDSLTEEEKGRTMKHSSDLRKLAREAGILPPLPPKS